MKHTSKFCLLGLVLLLVFVTGCSAAGTTAPEQESAGSGEGSVAALKITGNVSDEVAWSEEEIRGMETVQVASTNNEGETESYTGVRIKSLLSMAAINPDASTVVFIAGDGKTAEVALSDVDDCEDCIFTFRKNGGFSVLIPTVSKKLLIKDVVDVQVE